MLLIEDTEEDVDLRPRSPPGPGKCRPEERGVTGVGDKDDRFLGVGIRGCECEVCEAAAISRGGATCAGSPPQIG